MSGLADSPSTTTADTTAPSDSTTRSWNQLPYTRSEWAAIHGVWPELLPFAASGFDPIDDLATIARMLADTPVTTRQVSARWLTGPDGLDLGTGADSLRFSLDMATVIHGWWPIGETSNGTQYANPDYVHAHTFADDGDTITDMDERVGLLETVGRIGLPMARLTPAFGATTHNGVQCTARRHLPVQFADLRQWGLGMLARTIKTMRAWAAWDTANGWYDHYPVADIGACFGWTDSTVVDHQRNHAGEYTPPADPTLETPGTQWSSPGTLIGGGDR